MMSDTTDGWVDLKLVGGFCSNASKPRCEDLEGERARRREAAWRRMAASG